ncbi:hypothetical protein ACSS6W_004092 [Trichoderma asperelloides]
MIQLKVCSLNAQSSLPIIQCLSVSSLAGAYANHSRPPTQTMLNCIDNSGAALVECALVVGQKRHARIGDRIVVVVQEQRGSSSSGMAGISAAAKVKRGDIRHAVVVRTRYPTQRRDGTVVRFDDNACVLLNKSGDPVGTRINGVVGAELKRKKWSKILSMAPMQA